MIVTLIVVATITVTVPATAIDKALVLGNVLDSAMGAAKQLQKSSAHLIALT